MSINRRFLEDLSNLTLVMCTYNRPLFATRAMRFWSNTNVNLIVMDGSTKSLDNNDVASLPNRIKYIHDPSNWTDRMLHGASLVQTDFAALINDDEFYLPNSLLGCIDALNKNQDLVSTIGHVAAFKILEGDIYFRRKYEEFSDSHVSSNSPIQRVICHMNPYKMTSLFAVTRTAVFIRSVEVASICSQLPGVATFELGFEIANSFQGKSRVLPQLHWLRSSENSPNWRQSHHEAVEIWLKEECNSDRFQRISNLVAKTLGSAPEDNHLVSDSILFVGLSAYVDCQVEKNQAEKTSGLEYIVKCVRTFLKYFLKKVVGEKSALKILNYFPAKLTKVFFSNTWVAESHLVDSFRRNGLEVSEPCLSGVVESIKSTY